MWAARRPRCFPIDALAEFSIQTQGSAEYGRNSGAVVNTVIKSGTNHLHGTLYEFLRNDKLNARNFFETLPGATKGPFKNSNYGGTAGGPIKHESHILLCRLSKASGDGPVRRWQSACRAPRTSPPRGPRTPRPDGRKTLWARQILGLFPQENIPGAKANYAYSLPNIIDSNNFLVKIDHRFSDRFNLSGRYVFGDGNQTFPSEFGSRIAASELPDRRFRLACSWRAELLADADAPH